MSLKTGKIGLSATIFAGSGWSADNDYDYYVIWTDGSFDNWYGTFKSETSRMDVILAASYNIIPYVSIFAGYKNVSYSEQWEDDWYWIEYDQQGIYLNDGHTPLEDENDYSGGGPGGGLGLNFPLTANRSLIAAGSVGYFDLGGDLEYGDLIIEGGLNFIVGQNWVLSGSYRHEAYEKDISISGPSIGLTYFK